MAKKRAAKSPSIGRSHAVSKAVAGKSRPASKKKPARSPKAAVAKTQPVELTRQQSKVLNDLKSTGELTENVLTGIWQAFGEKSIDAILNEPTEVERHVPGFTPKIAKAVQKLLHITPLEKTTTAQLRLLKTAFTTNRDALYRQKRECDAVLARHQAELMNRPDVTGAHVGLLRQRGEIVFPPQYCIRIHVRKKWASSRHPLMTEMLPPRIDGVAVDVLERDYQSSRTTSQMAGVISNPVGGGAPISWQGHEGNIGTLGGTVFSKDTPCYITNYHVVGDVGNQACQPPNGNASGLTPVIGTVFACDPSIDCALITPSVARPRSSTIAGLSKFARFEVRTLTEIDVLKTRAFKVGAATDRTEGLVKSVSTIVKIGSTEISDQIIVESADGQEIIEPGDSGSLLLVQGASTREFLVVGLIHASSTDGTAIVAQHFDKIRNSLGVDVFPWK